MNLTPEEFAKLRWNEQKKLWANFSAEQKAVFRAGLSTPGDEERTAGLNELHPKADLLPGVQSDRVVSTDSARSPIASPVTPAAAPAPAKGNHFIVIFGALFLFAVVTFGMLFLSRESSRAREAKHVEMILFKMELLYGRVMLRSMLLDPGEERPHGAKEDETETCRDLDQRIGVMNAKGWTLCREELIEMRSIIERGRSFPLTRFQASNDELRFKDLSSRVKSKLL